MKLQHNSSGESSEDLIALIIAVHREREREKERENTKSRRKEKGGKQSRERQE